MPPRGKGATGLNIAKALIAFGRDVKGMPGKSEWSEQELHDERCAGLDPVIRFDQVDRLPGRREPLKSSGPCVPVEGVGL